VLCFDVSVNGKRVARAGVGEHGVLTAVLSWVSQPENNRSELILELGGLTGDEHKRWPDKSLSIGDQLEVVIVDARWPDVPVIERRDQAYEETAERKYYERLKEKYEH
jgi:hypothetical protein